MTTKYILKDDAPEGIYPGIGDVRHGQPITPYGAEHEQLLKDDTRFKQFRESATVTVDATVEPKAEAKSTKPADSGKDGK